MTCSTPDRTSGTRPASRRRPRSPGWPPGAPGGPRDHLALLDRHLVDLAAGRISRLFVTTPPQHGKSELCSVALPAWYLGTRPDRMVILAAYESTFAERWGRRARDLLVAASMSTRADYTVAAVWALTDRRELLLLDLERARVEGPDHLALLRRLHERHRPDWIVVERTGFQLTLVQQAGRDGLPIRELAADRDKVSRALLAAARMDAGAVYLPAGAPWLGDFVDELLAFPQGAHDDQVDVLAYAAAAAMRSPAVVDSLDLEALHDRSESLTAVVWRLIESPDKNLLTQPW